MGELADLHSPANVLKMEDEEMFIQYLKFHLWHMWMSLVVNLFADELLKVHKLKPNQNWRHHFENYLKTIPVYYAAVSVAT